MKILFVSENCSDAMYKKIERERTRKILPAQQNFFRLLLNGLLCTGEWDIQCLSAVPVSASCHPKRNWEMEEEILAPNFRYIYMPFTNTKFGRYSSEFISTYRLCTQWLKANKDVKEKVILCDSIVMQCTGAAKIAAKLHHCKIVSVVTDIPRCTTQIVGGSDGFLKRILRKGYDILSDFAMKGMDAYVLLTEYMNDEINQKRKPYIIVEGIASDDIINSDEADVKHPYAMYAGGIYDKFGVIKLANVYSHLTTECPLHIYGSGPDVDKIVEIEKQSGKVKYMGVLTRDEIVQKEKEARLLINPRPSEEEYTKYSFPSKTMEYMSSGTPVLSTPLKGIPAEYEPYIFWIKDETEQGMLQTIQGVLDMSDDELNTFGEKARDYVLQNKNYRSQGLKVSQLLKTLI